jgi:hypothetical protein
MRHSFGEIVQPFQGNHRGVSVSQGAPSRPWAVLYDPFRVQGQIVARTPPPVLLAAPAETSRMPGCAHAASRPAIIPVLARNECESADEEFCRCGP